MRSPGAALDTPACITEHGSRNLPAAIGDALDAVDTPALILDLDVFERNLATMSAAVRGTPVRLRPHAKSHKCPEIARRQIALGAVGICCQKVAEAEVFVAAGVRDVLITNEIVGAGKLDRLARMARLARIGVLVDDGGNVRDIAAAAARAGAEVEVLVELDVGAHRCGVDPDAAGAPALQLARAIAAQPALRFGGLHAYHGGAQHLRTPDERVHAIACAARWAAQTKRSIEAIGIPCPTVTGAGTGSFMLERDSGVYTELQPGSYIFMDADYRRNEPAEGAPVFAQSLFVWTSVMSRPTHDRAIVDAGLKASSVDSGLPMVAEWPGVRFVKASDEHGVLEVDAGAKSPALGTKLKLVPGHCDPTVNLYDWIVAVRKERVEALWPVSARGALL